VQETVSQYQEFNLTIDSVGLDARCHWLPEDVKKEIENRVMHLKDLNLLSEGVLDKVEESLAATPWVKEVSSVEKVFPDKIRFNIVLRRPVAWVEYKGRKYLVDSDCFRLPSAKEEIPEISHLPLIRGMSGRTSIPEVNFKWESTRLKRGVYVATCLLSEPVTFLTGSEKIRIIDLSDVRPGGRGVLLITDKNRSIEWGTTPLSGKVSMTTEEEKLAKLQVILEGEPSLDNRAYYYLWTKTLTVGPQKKTTGNRQ